MRTCEHLDNGMCQGMKILKNEKGVSLAIKHLPKFAMALGVDGENGKFTWIAQCVVANEPANQRHCSDFKFHEIFHSDIGKLY